MLNMMILRSQTLRAAALVAMLIVWLAVLAGCQQRAATPRAGGQGLPADAGAEQVARFITGQWSVTLNPDVVEAGGTPLTVPMVLQASAADEEAGLTGFVGEAEITAGSVLPTGHRRGVRFVTDSLTAENQEMQITAEGPLTWTGTLGSDGRLVGEVTDTEGRRGRWTATRSGRGR